MASKKKKSDKEETIENGIHYMGPKAFFWDRVNSSFEREGKIKKREKKSKRFNDRYIGVFHNYLLWFKLGKGTNGTPHERGTQAKGVIELERVPDESKIDNYEEKGLVGAFVVPTKEQTYIFQVDSFEQAQEWVRFLRNIVSKMKQMPRLTSEEATKKVKQVQQIFPEAGFNLPMAVVPDNAEKWILDMRKYREEYKNWLPFINGLTLYAEFNQGRTKGYTTWFNNKAKGVFESLNLSEESVLQNWATLITNCPEEMEKVTEKMYYMDEIKKEIERFEKIYTCIEHYNAVKKEFHLDDTIRFEEEGQVIQAWLEKLRSYPYTNEISFHDYTGGTIISDEESWAYSQETYSSKWKSGDNEDVEFTCKDHHFTFADPIYGTVIWNNKSFVWTHPRCPFIIRYDWFAAKGVFRQKMISLGNPGSKKNQRPEAPALSDWQLVNGTFRAVTVGQRNPEPEVPPITEWEIKGNIPPPAILLAAIFYSIRNIMREILGLNNQFVITGLNPIF